MNDNAKRREEFVKKAQEHYAKIAALIRSVWDDSQIINFEDSTEYKEAMQYYKKFTMKDGVDYTAAIAYAREIADRYEKTDKLLDEKADAIVKYLGGGTALVTFGALLSIKTDNWKSGTLAVVAFLSILPFLICTIWAVGAAIRARRPNAALTLPDIKFAVGMAEYHTKPRISFDEQGIMFVNCDAIRTDGKALETNLWLILFPICEAAYYRNIVKAKWVNDAFVYYHKSLKWLILPAVGVPVAVVAMMAIPDPPPPSSPPSGVVTGK